MDLGFIPNIFDDDCFQNVLALVAPYRWYNDTRVEQAAAEMEGVEVVEGVTFGEEEGEEEGKEEGNEEGEEEDKQEDEQEFSFTGNLQVG